MDERFRQSYAAAAGADESMQRETDGNCEFDPAFYRNMEEWGRVILGRYGFNVVVDPRAKTFAMDHERREVILSPRLHEAVALNDQEALYIFSHELMHIRQLLEDPETYKGVFDTMHARADALVKKFAAEGKKIDPRAVFDAYHAFYNTVLDIHDNAHVERSNPTLQEIPGTQGSSVREALYRKLFPRNDIGGGAHSLQFMDALIMRAMGERSGMAVDPDIAAIIDAPKKHLGVRYERLSDYVRDTFFNADVPLRSIVNSAELDLFPIFERMLEDDIRRGRPLRVNNMIDVGFGGDGLEKMLGDALAEKRTTSQRAEDQMRRSLRASLEREGFTRPEIDRVEEIMKRTNEVWPQLVGLWSEFHTSSSSLTETEVTGFPTGHSVDIDSFVRDAPEIFAGDPSRARIMERRIATEEKSVRPKKITLKLILDLSGSMGTDERRRLQEATHAIAKSLIQHVRDMTHAGEVGSTPPEINLSILGFGGADEPDELLQFTPSERGRDIVDTEDATLDLRLWRVILTIATKDLGGTRDAGALRRVGAYSGKPEVASAVDRGDEVVVAIEVTDGETDTEAESTELVRSINARHPSGVFLRGIFIGSQPPPVFYDEDQPHGGHPRDPASTDPSSGANPNKFLNVWGEHGQTLEDVSGLRECLMKLLFRIVAARNAKSGG